MIVADSDYAPGHPARPFSWADTTEKFLRSVAFLARPLPRGQAETFVQRVSVLEEDRDVRDLVRADLAW